MIAASLPRFRCVPSLWPALLLGVAMCGADIRPVIAEEPSGLAMALAIEQQLADAIAGSEESVVAVARVRKPTRDDGEGGASPLQPIFPSRFRGDASPLTPDFVPNDFGAGVVLEASGLILTNYHVLGDVAESDFYVWSRRRPFKATVVSADPWFDLAVLRVDAKDLTPIRMGEAKDLRKGQIVIALGNPYAIARDGEVSASWGIISNLLRRAPRSDTPANAPGTETIHQYGTLIQTDARLNLGYSGGALINLQGEMIGLTTSFAAANRYETAAGFAIPVDESFKRTVETMKRGGRPTYGFFGVEPELLSDELRRDGFHGSRVVRVIEGTPAARARVQMGDVITHVNDQPVYDHSDLFRLVGGMPPESTARVRVLRGDLQRSQFTRIERSVVLSKKFVSSLRPTVGIEDIPRWRGMGVDYVTASPSFGIPGVPLDPQGCVYVCHVEADSAAWQAGLRAGVYVSHVDGKQITSPADFYSAVAGGNEVELRVPSAQGSALRHTVSP